MTTSTEELSIEELLTSLKKEMKIIKYEESKLKKQIILLNEQFGNLVIQASQLYPEILDEDFAKRSARYTRKSKPAHAMRSSQIREFNPDSQQTMQNIEEIKRSPSLPIISGVSHKAKPLVRQYSADTPTDKFATRTEIGSEQPKRNGVCRSPAFRFSQSHNRRSLEKCISREKNKGCVDTNYQPEKNDERFTENGGNKSEFAEISVSKSGSTTESSDGSVVSTTSQNSYSPDNINTERKKKLKRRLIESRKNQDVVNLGMF